MKGSVMIRRTLGLLACATLAACMQEPQEPTQPADAQAGRLLAERDCVGCHGLDGHGAAPGIPHLAAQPQQYLTDSLLAYRDGRRTHAALKDLTSHMSEDALRDVAAFYAGLPPLSPADPSAEPRPALTPLEQGQQLAQACADCHGADGNSTQPGVPSLAGQQPLYFMAASRAYLNGTRGTSDMKPALVGLSHIDLEKLALFYASQAPAARDAAPFGNPLAGATLSAACAGCHGAGGVSHDAATPSLAGQDPQYMVNALEAYRGHVRQHDVMLAERTLEEIENIAAFYAVQPSRAAEYQPLTPEALAEKCDRCHGAGAAASGGVPVISGQDRTYLIMALRAYRDDRRESSLMHKMSMIYSDSMIEGLAHLYSNQPPP